VLIKLPLNSPHIVAMPLLLGVGVAFKIYYVTHGGQAGLILLQTSLTADFFSGLTTATRRQLWLSSHPERRAWAMLASRCDDAGRRAAVPAALRETARYRG